MQGVKMMEAPTWMLLGEDEVNDAILTKRALAESGMLHAIVQAHDGVEVLDCLKRRGRFTTLPPGNPALVLLDLRMPRLDGLEVLQRVRADPMLRCVPIVIYTASAVPS